MMQKSISLKGKNKIDGQEVNSLFPESAQKIVAALLDGKDANYSIRELARVANVSYVTAQKTVKQLRSFGAIELKGEGPRSYIKVYWEAPVLKTLREMLNLYVEPLRDCAKDFAKKIRIKGVEGVILFGSVARGSASGKSDIDLLVLIKDGLTIEQNFTIERAIFAKAEEYGETRNIRIAPLIVEWRDTVTSFALGRPFEKQVEKEGQILWGKDPWKEGRLERA